MATQFEYHDHQWEVIDAGYAVGVSSGYKPKADTRGVIFRCVSDPSRGEVQAAIRTDDLDQLDGDRLRRELSRALIRQAIEGSQYTWRTVEGLAKETGIPPEEVHGTLENLANEFMRAARSDKRGRALYATRRKYRENTSFLQRYLDVLNSPSS